MPDGADAVVIQEDVTAAGTSITIREAATRGDNVRPKGQDFAKGTVLLDRGRRLTARDILLAAASGRATLPVIRKPIVALLSTGDELVMPGTTLAHGQISASNSLGLAAVVEAAGGEATRSRHCQRHARVARQVAGRCRRRRRIGYDRRRVRRRSRPCPPGAGKSRSQARVLQNRDAPWKAALFRHRARSRACISTASGCRAIRWRR